MTLPVQLTDLIGKITNLSDSFRLGLGERASELENALQAETMQESVAIQDQTQNLLATQSAAVHNDALMDRGAELSEIRTKTEYSEESCVFDAVTPHYVTVTEDTKAYTNAMTTLFTDGMTSVSRELTPEYLAEVYGPEYGERLQTMAAADGDFGLIREAQAQMTDEELMAAAEERLSANPIRRNALDYDLYLSKFCNVYENGGRAPCRENGSRVDDDIEISRTLFGKDTLDVDGMEDLLVLGSAVDNLVGRPRTSTVPRSALDSVSGREQILKKRESAAHMNASVGLIWDLVAERMPSSQENEYIGNMRKNAGVPESDISERPSKYEFRQAYIEHVNSPPYIFQLKGSKDKMAQQDLHLKALRLMMMNELNSRMERLSTMFAIQLSNQLSARGGND